MPNLAWACFHCNNNKGTDIATYDLETRKPVFLYNPLYDKWDEHFLIENNGYIRGKTAKGRGTLRLLKMNAPKRVEIRKVLIQAGLWNVE